MSANERLTGLVDPVVSECGFVLDGVAVSMAGKRRLVRITLDRLPEVGADGWTTSLTTPLSLDEVADVSREINGALELADVFGAAPLCPRSQLARSRQAAARTAPLPPQCRTTP